MVAFNSVLLVVACLSLGEGARKKESPEHTAASIDESTEDYSESQLALKNGAHPLRTGRGLLDIFGFGHSTTPKHQNRTQDITLTTPSELVSRYGCTGQTETILGVLDKLGMQIDHINKELNGITNIKNEVFNIGTKLDFYRDNTNEMMEKTYKKIDPLINDDAKVWRKLEQIYQTVVQREEKRGGSSLNDVQTLRSSINTLMSAVHRIEQNQKVTVNNIALLMKTMIRNEFTLQEVRKALDLKADVIRPVKATAYSESVEDKMMRNVKDVLERVDTDVKLLTKLFHKANRLGGTNKARDVLSLTKSVKNDVLNVNTLLAGQFGEMQRWFESQTKSLGHFWRSLMEMIYQHHANTIGDIKNELKKLANGRLCSTD